MHSSECGSEHQVAAAGTGGTLVAGSAAERRFDAIDRFLRVDRCARLDPRGFPRVFPRGFPAFAASGYDYSDSWWTPTESGWGLQFVQQRDIVFASLYVYGPDGTPRWYSGALAFTGLTAQAHTPNYEGDLYQTTARGSARRCSRRPPSCTARSARCAWWATA